MSESDPPPVKAPARQRRRPRLAAEEVRERMFAAAKEIIRSDGVLISLEEIRLDDVIYHAGVPRSRAYRVWPYKGDFVNDLLMHLAGPEWMGTAGFDPETLLVATEVVLEHWDRLATPEGRRAVVCETVRLAIRRNITAIMQTVQWETYVALAATARGSSNDESRPQLNAALQRTEVLLIGLMSEFYAAMFDAVGLQLRNEGLTYGHLAVAGAAVVDGIALRNNLAAANSGHENREELGRSLEALLENPVPGPGIDGGKADWTIAAWAYLGILDAATEPIPDWTPTGERRGTLEELHRLAQEGHLSRLSQDAEAPAR